MNIFSSVNGLIQVDFSGTEKNSQIVLKL